MLSGRRCLVGWSVTSTLLVCLLINQSINYFREQVCWAAGCVGPAGLWPQHLGQGADPVQELRAGRPGGEVSARGGRGGQAGPPHTRRSQVGVLTSPLRLEWFIPDLATFSKELRIRILIWPIFIWSMFVNCKKPSSRSKKRIDKNYVIQFSIFPYSFLIFLHLLHFYS